MLNVVVVLIKNTKIKKLLEYYNNYVVGQRNLRLGHK